MCIKVFDSNEDLNLAVELTKSHPELLYVHQSIKTKQRKLFPSVDITIVLYGKGHPDITGNDRLWLVLTESETCRQYIHIMPTLTSQFSAEDVYEALIQISAQHPLMFHKGQTPLLQTKLEYFDVYKSWLEKHFPGQKFEFRNTPPMNFFYMTEEQKTEILKMNVVLPSEYYFADVDLENDSKIITALNSSLTKESPHDFNFVRSLLERMPYTIIKKDDLLVGFDLLDPSGMQRSLFVKIEHRGKGLGLSINYRLAQKCISIGYTPFRMIMTTNTRIHKSALNDPYWTCLKDKDDKPLELGVVRALPLNP